MKVHGVNLLDVSRLVSRAGLVPTGVDRVELAYLVRLTTEPAACFGLARTALGFVLLDRAGLLALLAAIESGEFPRPDLISRLNRRLSGAARHGQSLVRKLAVARGRPHRLAWLLARLGPDLTYFNVGHSNLTGGVCRALGQCQGARLRILLHDTIPLDLPDMQREGAVADFAQKFSVAARYANQIICTSAACKADVVRHLRDQDRQPPIVVAHLGVVPVAPDEGAIPDGTMPQSPYFVMVGTIEPRKNHAMILDIWDAWGADAPALVLCGTRGWRNEAVFARLDAIGAAKDGGIVEAPQLSDGAVAALLASSHGLLFPSFAEGFGLPPVEAAALGVPILCADLPACREILPQGARFLSPFESAEWMKSIKDLAQRPLLPYINNIAPPSWDDHFRIILTT